MKELFHWYFQVLKKYAVFSGRAERKEFWIFGLIHAVIILALEGLNFLVAKSDPYSPIGLILMFYVFGTFIPMVAASVRRLHDTNRTGRWELLVAIPLIGIIPTVLFMLEDSQPGENRYGPCPKKILEDVANPADPYAV
jgi:uncharacterized membrane protein YhaH (DUF805 family)